MRLKVLAISLFCTQTYAINIMPEIRTTVAISKADINRISCSNGIINSVDYANNTGLTHKTHQNKKNIIILFKQLDNGITRKIIDNKVNILIGCNNEYYPLILDPQKIDSQSIFLKTSKIEQEARKNHKANKLKTHEQLLVDLIKNARNTDFEIANNQTPVYLDTLQVKLLSQKNIAGTNYQINKFIVIANNQSSLTENQFLSTKLSKFPIVAISLDDFHLNEDKNYTNLYLVVESRGAQ